MTYTEWVETSFPLVYSEALSLSAMVPQGVLSSDGCSNRQDKTLSSAPARYQKVHLLRTPLLCSYDLIPNLKKMCAKKGKEKRKKGKGEKMSRRKEVKAGIEAEEFLKAAGKERDKRVYGRLLALHHVQQGDSYVQVGKKLCVHWRSVQNWVRRYNTKGIAGLGSQPGRGRKPMLTEALGEAFKRRL